MAEHGGDTAEMSGVGNAARTIVVPGRTAQERVQQAGHHTPGAAAHAAPVTARSP
ncbi:hypothetical protein [Methylobacterium sp. W2]|uniref:hypothetical protein n=1 Tax=Methylobacterium sp. W2 TaxID=2598107 RepID=UPI001D0CC153|nr:hypothetical protein [Methylobacterium sp. W2]